MAYPKYILITAARNEQAFIEKTIQSIISQTVLPEEWIIVSDGSTDNTEKIVSEYESKYNFIRLVKFEDTEKRNFASKVHAIKFGLSKLNFKDYDFIGILDADITFDKDHYELILSYFEKNSKLGIAGGKFYDVYDGKLNEVFKNDKSVRGATALFRRECFEDTGGFIPLKYGGEDAIISASAMMHGWEVTCFEKPVIYHNRRTGGSETNIIHRKFIDGISAYMMGNHPLFQLLKSFHRFLEKPYVLGGLSILTGFIWANIKREERPVPGELVQFIRKQQLTRIKKLSIN